MLGKKQQQKLIILQKQMSDLTSPECAKSCMLPHSCCSPEYCEMAISYAKEEWGIDLKPVSKGPLPFMGKNGCIVAPHLRPLCTLHTCDISSFGFKRNDLAWTKKYFQLRAKIDSV